MNKEPIQSIFIKQTETKNDPKPYVAYRVDVHAAVRQWHLWKRYSDFTQLNEQLQHTFPDHTLPASLPHRRIFPHTIHSSDKIDDRRQALEDYLRAILSSQDDRWRKTDIWSDFLALPTTLHTNKPEQAPWIDEYDQTVSLVRDIRSSLNSRDTYQNQQNVASAKQYEMKAKKDLITLNNRLSTLESGITIDASTDGEERRREDQLNALKSDRDVLAQLVHSTRQDFQPPPDTPPKTRANEDVGFTMKRVEPSMNNKRTAQKTGHGRAFGAALQKRLQETEATRGLDNQQLLEYQNQIMKDQDKQVEQFSNILGRQKELGFAINDELENHIDILDSLENQVDKTTTKLKFTNKKLNKIQ